MRLGLVTDIHNHAPQLAAALALFREQGVDQVVTIGDTWDAFGRGDGMEGVASMLGECRVQGVWGNHDFGLCHEVSDETRAKVPASALGVMACMQPRLVIGHCHFSHRESSVDPFDITQLWDFSENKPALIERAHRAFDAVDSPWQFVGHYHRWWAATPQGSINWTGTVPLRFEPAQRYFVIVAPVFDGWCAVLDTDKRVLEPHRCEVRE